MFRHEHEASPREALDVEGEPRAGLRAIRRIILPGKRQGDDVAVGELVPPVLDERRREGCIDHVCSCSFGTDPFVFLLSLGPGRSTCASLVARMTTEPGPPLVYLQLPACAAADGSHTVTGGEYRHPDLFLSRLCGG